MKGILLKIKIFLKEIIWLGKVNKFLYAPRRNAIDPFKTKNKKNEITIYEVIPSNKSILIINSELLKYCNVPEVNHYREELVTNPVYIADIKNGRLYTDGSDIAIMTSKRLLLEYFSVHYTFLNGRGAGSQTQVQSSLYNQKYYYPPTKIKGVVLNLQTGGGGENYFHFLFDMLPGYFLAKKTGFVEKIDFFYIQSIDKKFHREIFKLLEVDEEKIITNKDSCHIQADNLITFTHPNQQFHIPQWIIDFLRNTFLKMIVPDRTQFSKIFISRKDSSYGRQIINEEELLEKLKPLGYKRIVLSDYSFLDQVKIFNSADVIISPHGAGLANLTFCNPNTNIIEIFSQDFVTPLFHCLSIRVNLKHTFLITEDYMKLDNNRNVGYSGIFIDIDKLLTRLSEISV